MDKKYATQPASDFENEVADLSKRLNEKFEMLMSLQWVEHAEATERLQSILLM